MNNEEIEIAKRIKNDMYIYINQNNGGNHERNIEIAVDFLITRLVDLEIKIENLKRL